MIFKHEFLAYERSRDALTWGKQESGAQVGMLIAKDFGHEQVENGPHGELHFKLEVVAFPKKDWEAFRRQLFDYIQEVQAADIPTSHLIVVNKLLKGLEYKRYADGKVLPPDMNPRQATPDG